jgi:hypothetical protein
VKGGIRAGEIRTRSSCSCHGGSGGKISRRGDGGSAGEVSAGICGRGVTAAPLDETRQAATWWPASCQECGRHLATVLELGGDGTCRRFNGGRGVEQQGAVTSWASAMC